MSSSEKIKKEIAGILLEVGAIFLRPDNPFTWASGIKSPIYCDNRLTLSAPKARLAIESALAEVVKSHYPDCEVLMGTATAGIAHAAITAHLLELPMGYVRSSAKGHGRENLIEGKLLPEQRVVLVEDLISTGGSAIAAAQVILEAGAIMEGIVSIFTYNMKKGLIALEAAGFKNVSLTNFDTLIEVAVERGIIPAEDKSRLIAFRDNPGDEGWMRAY